MRVRNARLPARPGTGFSKVLGMLGAAIVALFLLSPAYTATFTVTNLNDSGVGSLRQAILDANAAIGASANTIVFQSGLSGNLLTVGNLRISGKLNLIGPGANVLTPYGNGTTIFGPVNFPVMKY